MAIVASECLIFAVPPMPSDFNAQIISHGINISWSLDRNTDMQTIDHYILHVDDSSSLRVGNASLIFYISEPKPAHNITIRAVDKCGQIGQALKFAVIVEETPQPTTDFNQEMYENQTVEVLHEMNGQMKGEQ